MERQQPQAVSAQKAPQANARIAEMQRLLDDRDETIRLLNEALSRALDDLERRAMAA